jgi:DNA-binding protein H-NS
MADIDLSTMTDEDLKALRKEIDATLVKNEKRRKDEALKAIHDAANQYGFSLEEIISGKTRKSAKSKGEIKYRHPQKPDLTWTGKGRRPEWIKEAVESGADLEKFAA